MVWQRRSDSTPVSKKMVSCFEQRCALLHLSPRGRRHHQQWVTEPLKALFQHLPVVNPCIEDCSSAFRCLPVIPHPPYHMLDLWLLLPSSLPFFLPSLPLQPLSLVSRQGPARFKICYSSALHFVSFPVPSFPQPQCICLNVFGMFLFSCRVAVLTWRRIRMWRWPMTIR